MARALKWNSLMPVLRARRLSSTTPLAALAQHFAGVRAQERVAVVLVQPRTLVALRAAAHALADPGECLRVAPQRAADDEVEGEVSLGEMLAEPARLAPAELGEPVVV